MQHAQNRCQHRCQGSNLEMPCRLDVGRSKLLNISMIMTQHNDGRSGPESPSFYTIPYRIPDQTLSICRAIPLFRHWQVYRLVANVFSNATTPLCILSSRSLRYCNRMACSAWEERGREGESMQACQSTIVVVCRFTISLLQIAKEPLAMLGNGGAGSVYAQF